MRRIVLALVVRRSCYRTGSRVQVLVPQVLKLAQLLVEFVAAALAEEPAEADCIAKESKRSCRRDWSFAVGIVPVGSGSSAAGSDNSVVDPGFGSLIVGSATGSPIGELRRGYTAAVAVVVAVVAAAAAAVVVAFAATKGSASAAAAEQTSAETSVAVAVASLAAQTDSNLPDWSV